MPEAARAEGAKEPLEVEAVVREALPNALYRVELSGGTRAQLVAHVAGESSLLRLRPHEAGYYAMTLLGRAQGFLRSDAPRGRVRPSIMGQG